MGRSQLEREASGIGQCRNSRGLGVRRQAARQQVMPNRELCDSLRGMIGEVPEMVKSCSLQGARNMERDTRRAVASLAFIGSLDSSFVN